MEEYNSRILQAKQAIKQADFIIIGAGICIQHHFMNLRLKKKNGLFLQK